MASEDFAGGGDARMHVLDLHHGSGENGGHDYTVHGGGAGEAGGSSVAGPSSHHHIDYTVHAGGATFFGGNGGPTAAALGTGPVHLRDIAGGMLPLTLNGGGPGGMRSETHSLVTPHGSERDPDSTVHRCRVVWKGGVDGREVWMERKK